MKLQIKRIYAPPAPSDGRRILADRLWPRRMSKDTAAIDYWAKDVAPSDELRRWYQHDPAKWGEFKKRYFAELDANAESAPGGLAALWEQLAGQDVVTLLFATKQEKLNNAAALREYLLR